ncbi:Ribonucleoprotein LSM domain eukaryotic/archaea-type [Penicillium cf. griseofulvum]|nr:Ribonucleoprotein LSM domain eukaryotic/archaea-type [Penicillium cf. griseofulvum]
MGKLTSTIGIPIKLLNEAQGHVVTIEITSGVVYRGSFWKVRGSFQLELFSICSLFRGADYQQVSRVVLLRDSKLTFVFSIAEDNMNVQLKDITVTARDGRVSHLDQVYIRGSHVRFFIVPDMLRNAPMFRTRGQRGRGVGLARGKATVQRARGQQRGRG